MGNDYYRWLISLVCDSIWDSRYHSKLLFDLSNIDFTWSIGLDENRAYDGLGLRYRYGYNSDRPCSVLEMMVGLAHRIEHEYIEDGEACEFFWSMIKSLGLYSNDDYHYDTDKTNAVIKRLLDRNYGPDGKGGLFYLKNPRDDLRNVQIWDQAMWYLTEKMYASGKMLLD